MVAGHLHTSQREPPMSRPHLTPHGYLRHRLRSLHSTSHPWDYFVPRHFLLFFTTLLKINFSEV